MLLTTHSGDVGIVANLHNRMALTQVEGFGSNNMAACMYPQGLSLTCYCRANINWPTLRTCCPSHEDPTGSTQWTPALEL
jgi:hypothetical protein